MGENEASSDKTEKTTRRILVVPNMNDRELCLKLLMEFNADAYIELALSKLLPYREDIEEIVFVKTKYWNDAKHKKELRHLTLFCNQQHKKLTIVDDEEEAKVKWQLVGKAIMFANLAHDGQKRKGTDIPYILHPMEAAAIVTRIKCDADLISAAWLHDTMEDAKFSHESISAAFNKRIADIVNFQSEDKSKSWKERKQHTIDELHACDDEGIKIVVLADKLSNIRDMHRNYAEIGEKLWERFNVKDKNLHGWYYTGVCDGLSSLESYEAYSEFKELVTAMFGDM